MDQGSQVLLPFLRDARRLADYRLHSGDEAHRIRVASGLFRVAANCLALRSKIFLQRVDRKDQICPPPTEFAPSHRFTCLDEDRAALR